MPRFGVYGLLIDSSLALPGLEPAANGAQGSPCITVVVSDRVAVHRRFSGPAGAPDRLATTDGEVVVQPGRGGDMHLSLDGVADCLVSADGGSVTCAPDDPASPAFARLLLDTVLGTAALCRGREGLHAAAVVHHDRLLAVTAPTGGGKSTLARELMGRGALLFSDDLVFFSDDGSEVVAHPGPAVMTVSADHARGAAAGPEQWLTVERPPLEPRRLDELVILDRRPGVGEAALTAEPSPLAWLAEALESGREPERQARRLDVLSRVAAHARVWRVSAAPEVGPEALADAIESGIEGEP